MRWFATVWSQLREWSGDDAYERYQAEYLTHQAPHHARHDEGHGHRHAPAQDPDHAPLSRRQFYRAYFDRRAKRPRCC